MAFTTRREFLLTTAAASVVGLSAIASRRWIKNHGPGPLPERQRLVRAIHRWHDQSKAPFLVGAGDSIMEGHNTATKYHSVMHGGPSGDPMASPLYALQRLIPELDVLDLGIGNQTWQWMAANADRVASEHSRAVWYHCGVNDVVRSRTWPEIKGDLDRIRAAFLRETVLLLTQILPWTDGTDAQSTAVRSLNEQYSSWCAANGAALIRCHDELAVRRPSTGALDDLNPSYDYDGVHLTTAGVAKFAEIVERALASMPW